MLQNGQLSPNDMGIRYGGNEWTLLQNLFPDAVPISISQPIIKNPGKRTARQFNYHGNFWYVVEKWAYENGFKQMQATENERLFKVSTMLVKTGMLKISFQNQEVYLESWVEMSFFTRLRTLFILPAEVGIDSGFVAALPKGVVRKQINILLNQLGQPPIT